MSSRQERIKECKNGIKALQANLAELQATESQIKFGDIITCECGRRVTLYDNNGELVAINSNGIKVGTIKPECSFYNFTGENIFGENLLELDV